MAVAPPFLTYLTVFKSRLGLTNLLLSVSGFAHQSDQALTRKIRRILEEREPLDLNSPDHRHVFSYLAEKRIVGPQVRRSGRYVGYALRPENGGWRARDRRGNDLRTLPVFRTDIWMSDPAVP